MSQQDDHEQSFRATAQQARDARLLQALNSFIEGKDREQNNEASAQLFLMDNFNLLRADRERMNQLTAARRNDELFTALLDLQQQLMQPQPAPSVMVEADTETEALDVVPENDASRRNIINAYNEYAREAFGDDNEHLIDPETDEIPLKLHFEGEQQAKDFFANRAEAGDKFIVVDANMNVIAYSDGSGSLLGPDGNDFDMNSSIKNAQDDAPHYTEILPRMQQQERPSPGS